MSKLQAIAEVAQVQEGYFSSAQALEAGINRQDLHYYKKEGSLRSVCWGVYQLVSALPSESEELIALWLATEEKAIVSHESALLLHELSDSLPTRHTLTLPVSWKSRRLKLPYAPTVFFADLEDSEIEWRGCFRLTTPLRTLWDCEQSGVAQHLLVQAKGEAKKRGLTRAGDFQPLSQPAPDYSTARSKGIDQVLDEVACSCCPPRATAGHPHHFIRNYKLPCYSKPAAELLRSLQWAVMKSESQLIGNLAQPTQQRQLSPQILDGKEGPVSAVEPIALNYDLAVDKQDILDGNFANVTQSIESRAREEIGVLEKWIIDNFNRSAEAVGQVVRGEGPLTHDGVLDALEKVEVEFLPTGEIRDLQLILSPTDARRFRENPMSDAQKQRFQDIMKRKWDDWNAKQGRRRVR